MAIQSGCDPVLFALLLPSLVISAPTSSIPSSATPSSHPYPILSLLPSPCPFAFSNPRRHNPIHSPHPLHFSYPFNSFTPINPLFPSPPNHAVHPYLLQPNVNLIFKLLYLFFSRFMEISSQKEFVEEVLEWSEHQLMRIFPTCHTMVDS